MSRSHSKADRVRKTLRIRLRTSADQLSPTWPAPRPCICCSSYGATSGTPSSSMSFVSPAHRKRLLTKRSKCLKQVAIFKSYRTHARLMYGQLGIKGSIVPRTSRARFWWRRCAVATR
eukprot:6189982-Pleurochrysis_carterae.AAC.2